MLDGGKLAVTHAGIKAEYQGRASGRIRSFCLYGDTNGETDEWGLPVRQDWAASYQGNALVVYGHTPVAEPRFFNNTICIDTGCVFGGNLTALRYPERELISVPAARVHYEPGKPLAEPSPPGEEEPEGPELRRKERELPDVEEMTGTHEVTTRLMGRIRLETKQLEPALEVMSRFALDPRWLIYLPPTISPTGTSMLPGLLEHPLEAFQQYREDGVETVICEEKHMGSRGVVIIGRDSNAIRDQFGIQDDKGAACYSRTGRRFFNDSVMEAEFFQKAREAIGAAGLWEELETGWLALDCEIMPWNLKAQRLIQSLYAPTGAAAVNTLTRTVEMLQQAAARGVSTNEIAERTVERLTRRQQLPGGLPPLLLERRDPDGGARSALPRAGRRGQDLRRQTPHLAPGNGETAPESRTRALPGNPPPSGAAGQPGGPGRGNELVGINDHAGRRGDGGETHGLHTPGETRPHPARREGPGPRVPEHHLRAGVPPGGQPGADAGPGAPNQAAAGAPGIRAGPGGAGEICGRRIPAQSPRVRLRRTRAGDGTHRPQAVGKRGK